MGSALSLQPALPSDQLQLSISKLKQSGHFNPKTAKVLLSVDYDGTLSTDLIGAERFQQQRNDCLLHLNTGRSVEDLAPLRDRFQGLKLYALSTSNGEGLFINRHGLPADRWLGQIAEQQQQRQSAQVPEWRKRVQAETGWDHFKAAQVIRSFIDRRLAHPGYGPLECVPRTRGAIPALLEALRKEGIQADFSVEDDRLHKFGPQGFAKDSPVGFLARQCPNLQRVVVAGDGFNDYALMTLESVVNGTDQPVGVDRVLMGRDKAFVRQVMQDAPNSFQVKLVHPKREESLFDAIAAQVALVDPPSRAGSPDPESETMVTPRVKLKRRVHPSMSPDEVAALFQKL